MKDTLTSKQRQILTVICDGNGYVGAEFQPVDMIELLDRIPYTTTKDSMQFSIRALVGHSLIVKEYLVRRGARRAVYRPTDYCRTLLGYESQSIFEAQPVSSVAFAHA